MAEKSSFTVSDSTQEQFIRPTTIKNFKMGEDRGVTFRETGLKFSFVTRENVIEMSWPCSTP